MLYRRKKLTFAISSPDEFLLFVNNESRNIGLKPMRLSFHFFIQSIIYSFVAFGTTARAAYDPGCQEAIHEKTTIKISDLPSH